MLLGSKQSPKPVPNYTKNPSIPPVITNDNIVIENIPSNNNDNKNNNFGGINTSKKKSTPKTTFTREYNQSKQGNPFERNR